MLPLLLIAFSLNCPDSNQHPIDMRLQNCLKEAHATMPRAECYNIAYHHWELDIKNIEKKLLAKATTQQKEQLRTDELNWEKERDLAFDTIAIKYNKMRGTGYIPVRIQLRMDVLRKHALELEAELTKFK